ncbi:MAG: anti-sigma factor domain-containing protein [Clostridium sp.]
MYHKGLIIELKKSHAFVLKDDGTIVKINSKTDMKIGTSIYFLDEDIMVSKSENKSKKLKYILTPLMAVAMLMFVLISPTFRNSNNFNSYALITVDINPSISIEIDKNQTITKVEGLNDDGSKLSLGELNGKNLNDGITNLKELIQASNSTNKDSVIIGFTFIDDISDDRFEEDVKNVIKSSFDDYSVEYFKGSTNSLNNSKVEGISLGKYEALLMLDDDDILEDKLKKLSVPELIELLNKTTNEDIIEEIEDILEDNNDNLDDDHIEEVKPVAPSKPKPTSPKPTPPPSVTPNTNSNNTSSDDGDDDNDDNNDDDNNDDD